jgi:hypothetical protein
MNRFGWAITNIKTGITLKATHLNLAQSLTGQLFRMGLIMDRAKIKAEYDKKWPGISDKEKIVDFLEHIANLARNEALDEAFFETLKEKHCYEAGQNIRALKKEPPFTAAQI